IPAMCECKREARVHVIYVGGTIGMLRNDQGELVNVPNALARRFQDCPICNDKEYIAKLECGDRFLVLPAVKDAPYRIMYHLKEFSPLIDSSCMGMTEWQMIAREIGKTYKAYDGFVILQGTDTLAYTASALAFMLENLSKPVVVTGGQMPIFEARSDGRDNFLNAMLLAGNYSIPEVVVFFGNKILRGCRSTKLNADSFNALDSPNFPPLGRTGVKVEIDSRLIFRPCSVGKFTVHSELEKEVGLLRVYPGISVNVMKAFLSEPMKGVVLETFGEGNFPVQRDELLDQLREAVLRGVLILNITQCTEGMVATNTETGQAFREVGIIPGYDMTEEAALTKLAYVLSKPQWDLANKKKVLLLSLRGEMTTNKVAKINDIDLVEGVARTLHMSTGVEQKQMCATFYPALVAAAVCQGDVKKLCDLKQYGANLCDTNCDGRSALHLACFLGKLNCVCFLISAGCPINVHDRFNRTPLHEAIDTDNHKVIQALLQRGAKLNDQPLVQAEMLRALTERCKVGRLESFRLAGADLTLADRTGRTALHYACQLGSHEVVDYLLPHYKNPYVKDEMGMSPLDYAKAANHEHIITLMRFKEKERNVDDPCTCQM
ncbi:hypothetical protein KR200_004199, partial [Drosophila serrata]